MEAAVWADDIKGYGATIFDNYHFTNMYLHINIVYMTQTTCSKEWPPISKTSTQSTSSTGANQWSETTGMVFPSRERLWPDIYCMLLEIFINLCTTPISSIKPIKLEILEAISSKSTFWMEVASTCMLISMPLLSSKILTTEFKDLSMTVSGNNWKMKQNNSWRSIPLNLFLTR